MTYFWHSVIVLYRYVGLLKDIDYYYYWLYIDPESLKEIVIRELLIVIIDFWLRIISSFVSLEIIVVFRDK